ncbi:ATG15 [[Candida] subhashii]|uniref:triacylglycerol lipase n=1 Tax=[Candida] subhashii TaxID=561895 RepID=A0A8J5Q2C2_9ASCO|nr:ATG15 [[Candida] subhashii]KAG7660824.1 ATG15 [[Candida] subhashii]
MPQEKQTKRTNNCSWCNRLPSKGIVWFILISFLFIITTNHSKITNKLQQTTLYQTYIASDNLDASETLQLKHIFHHGTGPHNNNHKIHRRLDITPEYIAKHYTYFTTLTEELQSSGGDQHIEGMNDFDQVYTQMDWPKVHHGKNPFTIQLPIKKHAGISTRLKHRHEPNFVKSYLNYVTDTSIKNKVPISLEWIDEEIRVPNITDRNTLISLATISSNAYVRLPLNEDEKKKSDWVDLGDYIPDINGEIDFGWNDVGIRGHVFVSKDNKTVVIGIKGTSGAGLPGGGSDETAVNDKLNDNLLFSCCCARVGYMWTTVCDCYEKAYTCNQDCLEKELVKEDRYYAAVLDLYNNVTALYPPDKHDIWVTGHSLGGALASLLGRTFGLPVVAFEAPGEMLATQRLHLPFPPGIPSYMENVWHIGNTADPIYMGVCNGASSTCNAGGYAMETSCHTGLQCVYDVVGDLGWRVNILNHRIHTVIDDVILAYNDTAKCIEQPPCRDCFNWRFVAHDDDEDDEPELPNPLKPLPRRKSSTLRTSSTNEGDGTKTGTESTVVPTSSEPPDEPEKCLKRTWYGWCIEWGHEADGEGDDGDKKKRMV